MPPIKPWRFIFLLSLLLFFPCKHLDRQVLQNSIRETGKYQQQKHANLADPEDNCLREEELLHTIEVELNKYKEIRLVKEQQFPPRSVVRLGFTQPNPLQVTIVIDVFRAFTTTSYVLAGDPVSYLITTKSAIVSRLASAVQNPLLIGKPEIGARLAYDIPNSPTRVTEITLSGRPVLHRTEAGARGILLAKEADMVLVAGFVNADATVEYLRKLGTLQITLAPMGHEATRPSLEDHLCALYIAALINNKKIEIKKYFPALRRGSGKYFFSRDQWQYPQEDFKRCLETGRYNFAIRAVIKDDYALLTRCE